MTHRYILRDKNVKIEARNQCGLWLQTIQIVYKLEYSVCLIAYSVEFGGKVLPERTESNH